MQAFITRPLPPSLRPHIPTANLCPHRRPRRPPLMTSSPQKTANSAAPTTTQPPAPRAVISSLEHVSYNVGGVRVIDDITLNLMEGEIVCILGPSGSGKSTILRILAGLTAPSSGLALYKGRPFSGTNPGASIVFQTFALYPWLTVLENVELGLSDPAARDPDFKRARAMRAIDVIGLDGYENAYPRELSGGMRQRVGFARALAVEPEFLCMDEPFSALDVLTAENLRSELLRLWQAGDVTTTSVFIVTHGIEEAVSLADRIVILGKDPGHIRTILPINMSHPRNRKSTLFQEVTDLVYTILSERDYAVSADDIRILKGEASTLSTPSSPTSVPLEPPDVTHRELRRPMVPAPDLQTWLPADDEYREPRKIALDALSLSEPLRPVSTELLDDINEPAPSGERYPQLPAVRIGSVSGLLSFIAEEPADLYLLGQRLQLDVDDLYPLIDAASILGLIEVDEGDVRINVKGQRFIEASIDDRKNIVRLAALSAPGARLIAQIYRLLSQAINQKLPQELIFDTVLLKHFSPLEARRQLEIAIEWGRFAELFGYESLTGTLFLDTGEDPDRI